MNLSFTLPDSFITPYATRPVDWGFEDAGGNSVGEITFLRTYSRLKPDGTKERWHEVCRRVIEGMFSLQRDHARANRLPWSSKKAQATARDAYERLFTFKWTPPGRGLWIMGTPLVNEHRNSAALQNCAFVSTADMTRDDPAAPFAFLMEASMLGIGVGFDTKGADKGFRVYAPRESRAGNRITWTISDDREGWVASVVMLLESYLKADQPAIYFNYSDIRPAGTPIATFGGTAAGPAPLQRLHEELRTILDRRSANGPAAMGEALVRDSVSAGQTLTATDIADIGNLIGVCVVSGNVRRSAELLLGKIDDEFLSLKDYSGAGAARSAWSWMSNNSVEVVEGEDLSRILPGIATNGEPGIVRMDLSRRYGRLIDAPNDRDHRAVGYNPCAEQTLESFECCTLVETYINRHDDLDDYKRTLKVAYLYAKTVTLLPTHWPRVNAIMQRNRRIGTSMSGIANFLDRRGLPNLIHFMDEGYAEVQRLDRVYSEWLCVRESIKTTTVKPGGTTPLLAGESPGAHWSPGGRSFERAIRFSNADPMVTLFRAANYRVEVALENPETTVVVYFPISTDAGRSEAEVSIYEKANLAVIAQRWWSDNSVSVTVSFNPETEADDVARVLAMHEGEFKTISFLPMTAAGAYAQMPYTPITAQAVEDASMRLFKVDLTPIYEGAALDAAGEAYCTTDACEVKTITN